MNAPPPTTSTAVGADAVGLAIPPVPIAPKNRTGNSLSSSRVFGIGIGPDIVPRMDLLPALTRPAFEPDFHMLGISSARRFTLQHLWFNVAEEEVLSALSRSQKNWV